MTDRPEQGCAWLLWGRLDGESKPLGCYLTRDIALAAEDLHKSHENAGDWEDIWVTPWPLSTEPRINFRMKWRKEKARTDRA
jgi:hypothetical protein